ncbi:MAG: VCBS repeat-containing protein [Planctomycetia bacterium]|nr:VCBS repeat-containing protein [Planctomycetia bacterium]
MRNHSAFMLLACAAEMFCAAGAAAEEFSRSHTSAWHLSIVDGGKPRGAAGTKSEATLLPISSTTKLEALSESDRASWSLQLGMVRPPHAFQTYFGPTAGTPIAGDFNGDGYDELGMFVDGRWYVDLNGNNTWDRDDLWASFGNRGDVPVVGDWNQDGKDDFGIVTRSGVSLRAAASTEPGFAHPLNTNRNVSKNLGVPRTEIEPALLRTSSGGEQRAAVRHVFEFGAANSIPVVGDWTGTGVSSIGTFQDGCWKLDLDGDGRWTTADAMIDLGQPGDLPIVGDFNRDGRDDLGIYRRGTWHIDTTGDRRLGNDDLILQLGDADDTPVVGDWDGDGRAQIGVVHRTANGS